MTQIQHPEWRAENDESRYPFSDSATLTNSNGDFFTEGVFLDAIFYPIGGKHRLYISKVVVSHETCTLYLGDATNNSLASGSFSLIDPPYNVEFTDNYDRAAGLVVSEPIRLSLFQAWSVGEHVFQIDQTELAASVSIPTPQIGLQGIILDDGTVFSGDIWIVGDDGVVVRSETVSVDDGVGGTTTYPLIRVDVVGDPLFRRQLCSTPIFFQTPRFIQTITATHNCENSVVAPDAFGNMSVTVGSNLAADTVLRIRPAANGLVIETVGESLKSIN